MTIAQTDFTHSNQTRVFLKSQLVYLFIKALSRITIIIYNSAIVYTGDCGTVNYLSQLQMWVLRFCASGSLKFKLLWYSVFK